MYIEESFDTTFNVVKLPIGYWVNPNTNQYLGVEGGGEGGREEAAHKVGVLVHQVPKSQTSLHQIQIQIENPSN